jgi:hypothetical protein
MGVAAGPQLTGDEPLLFVKLAGEEGKDAWKHDAPPTSGAPPDLGRRDAVVEKLPTAHDAALTLGERGQVVGQLDHLMSI